MNLNRTSFGFKWSWKTFYILLSLPLLLIHQNCGQKINSDLVNSPVQGTSVTPDVANNPNNNSNPTVPLTDTNGFEKISDTAGICYINQLGQLYCYDEKTPQNFQSTVDEQQVPKLHLSDKTFVQVASAHFSENACAITSNNKLYCKGSNELGQVGDGTTTDRTDFVLVDPSEDYIKVSLTYRLTCGITTQNKLKCWGGVPSKPFANLTIVPAPTVLDNSDSYSDVAPGFVHICALNLKNQIKCLGNNGFNQLGISENTIKEVSTFTSYIADKFKKITSGLYHTCAINLKDQVICWGYNAAGQIGNGSIELSSTPVLVDSKVSYKSIFAGSQNTCGITQNDIIKCWGSNDFSEISLQEQVEPEVRLPKILENKEKITKVIRHNSLTCFLTETNFVKCIGRREAYLFKKSVNKNKPVPIDTTESYMQVAAANFSGTCGITTAGLLKCWGSVIKNAANYKIGISQIPVVVDNQNRYKSVQSHRLVTCAITIEGVLKCWGSNSAGLLGKSDIASAEEPQTVDQGVLYESISMNYDRNCGLTTTGDLKCWGKNIKFSSVNSESIDSPIPQIIDLQNKYKKISTSRDAICGITTTNVLKCWGNNVHAQLGVGETISSGTMTPVEVDKGVLYLDISLGERYTCGVTMVGVLKCWGLNDEGVLNVLGLSVRHSDDKKSLTPVVIDQGVSYKNVFLSSGHLKNGCAITTAGVLRCWGVNTSGQLGAGNYVDYPFPTTIESNRTFEYVNVDSYDHSCGIDNQKKIFCWGNNSTGQLGDNESFLNQYAYIMKVR